MWSNFSNYEITPMENPYATVEEEVRNWLELPCDLMLLILIKVGPFDIIDYVQFVCKAWFTLCKEPDLWRTIHIKYHYKPYVLFEYENKMFNAVTRSAIDRSAGGLIDLSIEGFGSDKLCSNIASQSSHLKHLRVAECIDLISEKALVTTLEQLSSLEELELTLCKFENEEAVSIINACPGITTFKFNNRCSRNPYPESDEEALAIAASMPQLCHLQLIGNNMTNVGLEAILDACPCLQSLDIRACYHLDLEGDLGERLSEKIRDVRHPYDSTEDYNYPTTAYHSYDERDYYCPEFSDYEDDFDPDLPYYDDDNPLLRPLYL